MLIYYCKQTRERVHIHSSSPPEDSSEVSSINLKVSSSGISFLYMIMVFPH